MAENGELQSDVESQKRSLESALAIGEQLVASCSEEDRPALADKLDALKERYEKLNAKLGSFASVNSCQYATTTVCYIDNMLHRQYATTECNVSV